eukprot:g604.t1
MSSCPSYYHINVTDFETSIPVWSTLSYCHSVTDGCSLSVDPTLLGATGERGFVPSRLLRWSVTSFWDDGKEKRSRTTSTPVGFIASSAVTPSDLRRLYNIPSSLRVTHPNATQAVYEEHGNFSRTDLAQFLVKTKTYKNKTIAKKVAQNVFIAGTSNDESRPDGESTMDIQLILGIAPGAPTTFWTIPPNSGDGSFLEWAAQIQEMQTPPLVHSVSWGPTENFASIVGISSKVYVHRVNIELLKMGLRGLSLLFADGDDGASCNSRYGNCTISSPVWPASSPYGAGVGATFIAAQGNHNITEYAMSSDIGVAITTGGGFSYLSKRPKFQDRAVLEYFDKVNQSTLPPDSFFQSENKWQMNRALPDISAVGSGLFIVENGKTASATGASASTPIIAAIVTLLNDDRLHRGFPPMGPIAPFFLLRVS